MRKLSLLLCPILLLLPNTAMAYIGPGVGAGTIAVVLGILASILMAFVALLWYPMKRLVKGRKAPNRPPGAKQGESSSCPGKPS